jgi:hypothetical protein
MRFFAVLLVVAGVASSAGAGPRQDEVERKVRKSYAELRQLAHDSGQSYPVVELITMGVGSLIWERHGHIAICIDNGGADVDCYNYGIADFRHPLEMTAGFFRGTHSFWVGKMDPLEMLWTYVYADRTIWAQVLPLDAAQKKEVGDKLEYDIQDANRYYAYDHFWDNCTTRVRDILDHATGGALSTMKVESDGLTYRDLARRGFFGMRVPLIITDIAMGRVTDRVPTYYEKMFLPEYLREAVQKKWGVTPVAIYTREGPPPPDDSPSGRFLFALLLIVMTAPAWATKLWGRFEKTGLAIALVPQVILGTVFWFLAIVSPLPYVRWNESCLVLIPIDLAMLFLSPRHRRQYARGRVIMLGLLLLLMIVGVLHQPIWPELIWPLVPAAVVGFWPERPAAATAPSEDTTKSEKRPRKKSKK